MANETIKLKFKDDFNSPTLEIGHGEYSRRFDAKDQPFEITGVTRTVPGKNGGKDRTVTVLSAKDEAAILMDSGHFVVVEDGKQQVSGAGNREPVPPASAGGSKTQLASNGKIGGAPAESVSSGQ